MPSGAPALLAAGWVGVGVAVGVELPDVAVGLGVLGAGTDVGVGLVLAVGLGDAVALPEVNVFTGERLCHLPSVLYATK
ncbi:hypothetical protein [Streptomyces luteolifulvus]|uniref:hypothetical protein n=1 Tax=Streptomyces luteolifulvus TaxID=2615112 RepID=UPI0017808CA8|nr:hypothetical protein [Streptomyces luteolifulvus]